MSISKRTQRKLKYCMRRQEKELLFSMSSEYVRNEPIWTTEALLTGCKDAHYFINEQLKQKVNSNFFLTRGRMKTDVHHRKYGVTQKALVFRKDDTNWQKQGNSMALSELQVCHFVTNNWIYLSLTSLIFNSQVLNLLVDKASVNKSTRLELPV